MMRTQGTILLVLVAVLVCTGAADKQADQKKEDAHKESTPACMQCGATCGLQPICVCEPGTKKQPKIEFDTTCDPVCIPACGSHAWPFGGRAAKTGCTSCCEEPCACPSRVRFCKKIKKETVDEEVPTVVRKVQYVCDCCAGRCVAGCCDAEPRQGPPAWWRNLTWWWPRKPAG